MESVLADNAAEGSGMVPSSPKLATDLFSPDPVFSSQLDTFLSTGVVPPGLFGTDGESCLTEFDFQPLTNLNADLVSQSELGGPMSAALDHSGSLDSTAQAAVTVCGIAEEVKGMFCIEFDLRLSAYDVSRISKSSSTLYRCRSWALTI